jgi:hypothetical protein
MLIAGDKVSFVNEKQDGVVKQIKANGIVIVEIEEGFTLEVSSNELVKIKEHGAFSRSGSTSQPAPPEKVVPVTPDLVKLLQLSEEVSLVAVPESGKVLSGTITYFLCNNSSLEMLFTFSFRTNRMLNGKKKGVLSPGETLELTTVSHQELMEVEQLIVEAILYKEGSHKAYPRIYKEMQVELPGIQQTYPKIITPYSFAIARSLHSFEELPEPDFQDLFDKYKTDQQPTPISKGHQSGTPKNRTDTTLKDFGLSPVQQEVDLHIEELLEDTQGMSSSEMITLQLKHFQKELDKAIMSRSSKIVFIHGIGNGKLKNAIRHELRSMNISYRDASFEKYGTGATEVNFK